MLRRERRKGEEDGKKGRGEWGKGLEERGRRKSWGREEGRKGKGKGKMMGKERGKGKQMGMRGRG